MARKLFRFTRAISLVNFLGAIDDGTGKRASGFWSDGLHPNAAGHVEITRTFVPTLFEALERGKPMPRRLESENFTVEYESAVLSTAGPFTAGLAVARR